LQRAADDALLVGLADDHGEVGLLDEAVLKRAAQGGAGVGILGAEHDARGLQVEAVGGQGLP
jgi:hypothetical protein